MITLIGDEILRRASDRAKEMGAKKVDTTTSSEDPGRRDPETWQTRSAPT